MTEEPPPETVDALTPGMTGRWLVTTQGSRHVWDLDAMTYQRIPGAGRGQFAYDLRVVKITRVERWPRVGDVFHVMYDDPREPTRWEQWRRSSAIRRIERIAEDERVMLAGDERGRWLVTTKPGTEYELDLDAMTLTRRAAPESPLSADLRRDDEELPLLSVMNCLVGESAYFAIAGLSKEQGYLYTTRESNRVVSIRRLPPEDG